ncbi:hypothetical protein [Pseudomonas sp. Hp2]|uniref:hypothetical protein n=1 Tax=Pseudomonas sp. Hp2 TaxID=701189 RepID=UPI0011282F87|nr:hypothetical protein [Pseudomonas sp. Hp2]
MGKREHSGRGSDPKAGKAGDASSTDPRRPVPGPDPKAGLDREVGDLEDTGSKDAGDALPGRAGGGLAGA